MKRLDHKVWQALLFICLLFAFTACGSGASSDQGEKEATEASTDAEHPNGNEHPEADSLDHPEHPEGSEHPEHPEGSEHPEHPKKD
jgi:hypothetical protein